MSLNQSLYLSIYRLYTYTYSRTVQINSTLKLSSYVYIVLCADRIAELLIIIAVVRSLHQLIEQI